MSEVILGIDLGTTNSAVAVIENDELRVLPINGAKTMPSCVGIDDDGKVIVGTSALNQFVLHPDRTALSVKRKMGTTIATILGDQSYSPEELSSFVLKELKLHAEKELGRKVSKAVITVPAFFDERQRKATQDAAALAGLEAIRILNEPTAAALAYNAGQDDNRNMVVYDLGGGTFDVSIVVVENGIVEVKASHGDTQLGGDDFDDCLVNHVCDAFLTKHGVNLRDELRAVRRLKIALEKAKCDLSDRPYVSVREEFIHEGLHLDMEISRGEYEEMIQPMVSKTIDCIGQALQDAGLTATQIDKIMLVGGSSRTPLVQQCVRERLRRDPHFEIDPDLIVALGAGVQAGTLGGAKATSILVDITPHTYSMGTVDFDRTPMGELVCSPVIRRNTPLPARRAEVFYVPESDAELVTFPVFQGEGRYPAENLKLGEFEIHDLDGVPAGSPVVVEFSLDLNGMLTTKATDRTSGKSKQIVVDTRGQAGQFNLEDSRERLSVLEHATIELESPDDDDDHTVDGQEVVAILQSRAKRLLEGELSKEDRTDIEASLQRITEALSAGDDNTLIEEISTLEDILYYLEE
jgi:molecular chaperone DnaK